jgi:hypothetical protein
MRRTGSCGQGDSRRQTRRCGWPMPPAAEMPEWLHGRCGRPSRDSGAAPRKGWLAGGLELLSRGAAKQSSRSIRPLLSSSPLAPTHGKCRTRIAYLGHGSRARSGCAVDFPLATVIFVPFPAAWTRARFSCPPPAN